MAVVFFFFHKKEKQKNKKQNHGILTLFSGSEKLETTGGKINKKNSVNLRNL